MRSLVWGHWGLGRHLQLLRSCALLLDGAFAASLAGNMAAAAHEGRLSPGWAQQALEAALQVRLSSDQPFRDVR